MIVVIGAAAAACALGLIVRGARQGWNWETVEAWAEYTLYLCAAALVGVGIQVFDEASAMWEADITDPHMLAVATAVIALVVKELTSVQNELTEEAEAKDPAKHA